MEEIMPSFNRTYGPPSEKRLDPTIPIYPLNEAAKKADCEPRDLLNAGARGKIIIMVSIPLSGYKLCLLSLGRKEIGVPRQSVHPNLLALTTFHCLELERTGKVLVGEAPWAFSMDNSRQLIASWAPSECEKSLSVSEIDTVTYIDQRKRWKEWKISKIESDDPLEVNLESIWITKTEIYKFLGNDPDKRGNVGEDYKSNMLKYMNEAALEFWSLSIRNQKPECLNKESKYLSEIYNLPSWKKKAIVDYLIEIGFDKGLAEAAETIIRPSYLVKGRPVKEKDDFDEYTGLILNELNNDVNFCKSEKLKFLNDTAERYWGNSNVIKEYVLTYPSEAVITKWLIKNNFDQELVSSAVKILKPEFAKEYTSTVKKPSN